MLREGVPRRPGLGVGSQMASDTGLSCVFEPLLSSGVLSLLCQQSLSEAEREGFKGSSVFCLDAY